MDVLCFGASWLKLVFARIGGNRPALGSGHKWTTLFAVVNCVVRFQAVVISAVWAVRLWPPHIDVATAAGTKVPDIG
jgi:hypothetical protein